MKALHVTLIVLIAAVVALIGLAVFERLAPPRALRWFQKYIGNPLFRPTAGLAPSKPFG